MCFQAISCSKSSLLRGELFVVFFFASHVRVLMVRKGLRTVEVAPDCLRSQATVSVMASDEASPVGPQAHHHRRLAPQFPRRTPESNRTAAAATVARTQAGVQALGEEDPEEVFEEEQAKPPPPETQISHVVQFIARAKKRVAGGG